MGDARGPLRPVLSIQRVLLLAASFRRWDAVAVRGYSIIALTLPQRDLPSGTPGSKSEGFFPLSDALTSVMRLAVDDVNADGVALVPDGKLTLSVFGVENGPGAMEGLCNALEAVGENGTFGIVGPLMSLQASIVENISNKFYGLPMVTPSATAGRAASYFASGAQGLGTGPSYLFGTQPDIFKQMEALARLILDMKAERDTARGWYHTTERVSVIFPDDAYGPIAASAFSRAVRTTTGTNVEFNAAGRSASTIELASTNPVDATAGTNYRPLLESLLEKDASIIVLLDEGYDGVFVRSVLEQAREIGLVSNRTQWYLNGQTAKDSTFTVNDTFHDSQLAYDLRGTMGVRACPPTEGPGSDEILALTSRWESLSSEVYPGAGPGTLTPEGRLDPLLAYAYDAVFALASAIREEQMTAVTWGSTLDGFVTESCPFRTEGLWTYGESLRSSTLEVDFVGVTGSVTFTGGDDLVSNAAGAAGSGWRAANGTTFCALNLQPHATLGATFATMSTWRPEHFSHTLGDNAFEMISPFLKHQTYPAGGPTYPFDRPILNGVHFKVVAEEAAAPFAVITGRETKTSDYKGIALDLLQILSGRLGFTYSVAVANSSTPPDSVVASVAEGTYDMVASWITINAPRMDIVSFSYPYYSTGVSFVYRVEIVDEVSWWKMFKPFETGLWVTVLVTTVMVFMLLWVFDGEKNELFTSKAQGKPGTRRRQLVKGIGMSSYVTGALLMGQMAHEPFTLEAYIISLGWMFASFILAASFTAELASFLSADEKTVLAFGIDDLRNGVVSHNQVAVWQDTTLQTFYEDEIMDCHSTKECTEEFMGNSPQPCHTVNECFDLVANGTCKATIMDTATAEYRVANEFCGLEILPDTFKAEEYGLVLAKNSPYLGELQQELLRLGESATLTAISTPYFDLSRCAYLEAYEDGFSSQNLTLVDLGGVFLVLGIFVVVSIALWMFRRSPPMKKTWKTLFAWREQREIDKRFFCQQSHSRHGVPPSTTTEAPENGEDDLDVNSNSHSWDSTTNSMTTRGGRPSPIAEESKSGRSFEDANLLSRSPSPPRDEGSDDKPVFPRCEEAKYENHTDGVW